jgi:hypothetical protein
MSDPTAKKRRGPRERAADVIPDRHYNDCRVRWESRKRVDIFGDDPKTNADSEPPAGDRLADDLRRLYQLTGDPAFMEAGLALAAYGLAGKKPQRSLNGFWERSSPNYVYAPERVFDLHWRRAIARGDVTVRYVNWKKLPPKNSKT